MTTPHQQFRHGDIIESLAMRKDRITGEHYSQVIDIQETFTDAVRFKVNGVVLNFLEDDNGQRYEPRRIAHHPNDVIDVVVATSASALFVPSSSLINNASTHSGNPNYPSQLLLTDTEEIPVVALNLQPPSASTALAQSSNKGSHRTISIAHSMAALSSIASNISDLQLQLERSVDEQSAHHQQLLEQLIQIVAQQNEMVAQQNEMLRAQAESKEREEKMLAELEAAKERYQELHRIQQQTIDRLIVAQQRVDAILVQNYELHEYPIPRLFVILPDSYESWDPRNLLKERFRLFFLCECGNDCEQGTSQGTTADTPVHQIRARNRIHLAKHEGYELSRPTEFFDRYGLYVLGMLRILKHCLAVATVTAPAVALVDNGIKDVMDGVKSISESTMKAVDMSINFLEQELDECSVSDALAGTKSDEKDADDIFKSLAALEGADLRRLDTFLRNNDQDKILGNLYRTTTEEGHVKWVCFEHYQEKYRATALVSFVQAVEAASGTYNPHLRKVTIILNSSTTAKDFFKRLTRQAPAVDNLDVTLAWDFVSADLVNLVDMVTKSNVRSIAIDLQDSRFSSSAFAAFRPGKGRYHSLLGLLANKNLHRLQLCNLHQFGARTSNLPSSVVASWIQSFGFHGQVNDEGRDRLTNILSLCPNLVDLRLTGSLSKRNEMDPGLHLQIFASKKLQRLHVMGWYRDWTETPAGCIWRKGMPLRELVCTTGALDHNFVGGSIRQSYECLEVLVLIDHNGNYARLDLMPLASGGISDGHYFPRLTHLDLRVQLTDSSMEFLSSILPRLDLVYFGCDSRTYSLLRHVNLASLKSLSLDEDRYNTFRLLKEAIQGLGGGCQIEFLNVYGIDYCYKDLSEILKELRLKRLSLSRACASAMIYLFRRLNLSSLQIVSLYGSEYLPEAGNVLAQKRKNESAEPLMVQLDVRTWKNYTDASYEGAIKTQTLGASPALPLSYCVQNSWDWGDHHFLFLQPILPRYSY
ncbi:hypothetical protein F5H01DRAFT_408423 [Linnemannia elongata]|nr:hypothetical protein F5H01DRAFT_408423 [Linnemannia elongata]